MERLADFVNGLARSPRIPHTRTDLVHSPRPIFREHRCLPTVKRVTLFRHFQARLAGLLRATPALGRLAVPRCAARKLIHILLLDPRVTGDRLRRLFRASRPLRACSNPRGGSSIGFLHLPFIERPAVADTFPFYCASTTEYPCDATDVKFSSAISLDIRDTHKIAASARGVSCTIPSTRAKATFVLESVDFAW